jgi:hypothetical protein
MKLSISLASVFTLGVIVCISIGGCAGRPLQISSLNTILTNGESLAKGKKIPTDTFGLQDEIVFYVYITWDDPTQKYGWHPVIWNWYKNGKLVSTAEKKLKFNTTPYGLWTHKTASVLGSGHFKVETVVDGKVVGSTVFDIKQ